MSFGESLSSSPDRLPVARKRGWEYRNGERGRGREIRKEKGKL